MNWTWMEFGKVGGRELVQVEFGVGGFWFGNGKWRRLGIYWGWEVL